MEPNKGLSGLNIALLIDFDNVILGVEDPGFDVELVVNALRERGSIVMGRAYGDWYRHNRHRRKLMEQGLELVETPAFGPVIKNSADIRIALDGFEIAMTQHHIDTFCLVSGDSDFLPLIKKLQYLGKKVLVIAGNKFTSDMLRRNCNEFVSYENLLAQSVGATEDATTLEGAFALLHRGIAALRERGSEIRSSTVKQMMLQLNPVFSERTFGCNQFKQFLDKAVSQGLIKLGSRDKVSGEFTVLLPDEEESQVLAAVAAAAPATTEERPARAERGERPERGDRDRGRREDRRQEPAAPRAEAPSAPAQPAAPAPPGSDLFTGVSREEADHHATTTGALLGRGLRRGRLRFSGKSGRTTENPDAGAAAEPVIPEAGDAPVVKGFGGEALPSPEALWQAEAATGAAAIHDKLVEVADAVETAASQALVSGVSAGNVLPEPEEKPRSRSRSRRRRRSGGERGVADTAPATDEEGDENVAAAEAAGLTFPGEAHEIEEPCEPVGEPLEFEPSPAWNTAGSVAQDAQAEAETIEAVEADPGVVEGADAEAAPEEAEAAPAKKAPAKRRRSPRKKAESSEELALPGTSEAAPVEPAAV